MGLLVEGKWVDRWYDTEKTGGRFVRKPRTFRGSIGEGPYPAEAGRYHLYVSYACPWAHRTLIMRQLKGLEQLISVSVVDPRMADEGWVFAGAEAENQASFPGATVDHVHGALRMHELYTRAQADYTGRVTVPVLWDKQTDQIVNNESSEIIRIFDQAFDGIARPADDPRLPQRFYPEALRGAIDEVNELVYGSINDGVYRAGFATTQQAYDEAVEALFVALDTLEQRLAGQRYLVGDQLTEADIRLFTTLVRFDPVYHGHFKCNLSRLTDYPHLWGLTREIYQLPGVRETVDMDHIKHHYYWSHTSINPTRVVPAGPRLDFEAPHGRQTPSAGG
jgi:putative glutathione S-transferase